MSKNTTSSTREESKERKKKNKSNMDEISSIDSKAKALGMSYGQYVGRQYATGMIQRNKN